MKKSLIYSVMFIIGGLFLLNSQKGTAYSNLEPTIAKAYTLQFAEESLCKKYAEGACVVNDKAGKHCVGGVGDCKKYKECEALPDLDMADPENPTLGEIDAGSQQAANGMVANGDFCQSEWQSAYDVAHLSYSQFYGMP